VSESPSIQLVQDPAGLAAAIAAFKAATRLAVDTEFHAERRHHPELMLVQVNDFSGNTWIIDPLSVDISSLGPALAAKPMIVHSGTHDLEILWRETGHLPTDVFDVQLAAGLVGLGHPLRLSDLVSTVLQHPMDKSVTLSDWSKRPITPAQLAYAAADVEVLGELAEALQVELEELGRTHWVKEECNTLLETAKEPDATQHTWVNWDIMPRLNATVQRTLGCLFEWRNQKGRDKNQPANFMLSDGLALDIARRQPISLPALAANRRIPQGLIRRMGPEIIAVVRHVDDHEIDLPPVPTIIDQRRAKALMLWSEAWGLEHRVAPKLLMSLTLAHAVARDGIDALTGWRAEALAEPLSAFLSGKTHLGIGPDGPVISA
jgi:ribonuclease D